MRPERRRPAPRREHTAGFTSVETRLLERGDAVAVGYSEEEDAVIVVLSVSGMPCGVPLSAADARALATDIDAAADALNGIPTYRHHSRNRATQN